MSLFLFGLLERLPATFRLADLLDITVIAVFLYFAWRWLRSRASRVGMAAVISCSLLYVVARLLNMYLTLLLFQTGFVIILLAAVLVFQEDLRRLFSRIATFGFHAKNPSGDSADKLTEALCQMAEDRIGALVVLRGREAIEPYIEGGTRIDGRVSPVLLYSIFHPSSPGHDGAVLIDGDRIDRLGVHLPLSHNLAEIGDFGMRHTAALGLSERCDALVLIVSEERGTLRAAERGRLLRLESAAELRSRLDDYYRRRQPGSNGRPWHDVLSRHLSTKLAAFGAAMILWLVFVYQLYTVQQSYEVPIEYRNVPENFVAEDPRPPKVQVTLSGPEGLFALFNRDTATISFDLSNVREGLQELVISEANLKRLPASLMAQFEPRTIWINAQKLVPVELPVRVQRGSQLKSPLSLTGTSVEPERIAVLLPQSQQRFIHDIVTEPLDMEPITKTETLTVGLILPPYARFPSATPPKVRVTVNVGGSPAKP